MLFSIVPNIYRKCCISSTEQLYKASSGWYFKSTPYLNNDICHATEYCNYISVPVFHSFDGFVSLIGGCKYKNHINAKHIREFRKYFGKTKLWNFNVPIFSRHSNDALHNYLVHNGGQSFYEQILLYNGMIANQSEWFATPEPFFNHWFEIRTKPVKGSNSSRNENHQT